MSEDVDYLECDHCGGAAINVDADGLFGDGDGDSCITCGYPGRVVCDSETPPQWYPSDEGGNYCNDFSCKECGENLRIESKDDRQVAETWKSRALAAEAKLAALDELDDVLTRSAADEIRGLREALETIVEECSDYHWGEFAESALGRVFP